MFSLILNWYLSVRVSPSVGSRAWLVKKKNFSFRPAREFFPVLHLGEWYRLITMAYEEEGGMEMTFKTVEMCAINDKLTGIQIVKLGHWECWIHEGWSHHEDELLIYLRDRRDGRLFPGEEDRVLQDRKRKERGCFRQSWW